MLVEKDDAVLDGSAAGQLRILVRSLERNHFDLHNFEKEDPVFHTVESVIKGLLSSISSTHRLKNFRSLNSDDEGTTLFRTNNLSLMLL